MCVALLCCLATAHAGKRDGARLRQRLARGVPVNRTAPVEPYIAKMRSRRGGAEKAEKKRLRWKRLVSGQDVPDILFKWFCGAHCKYTDWGTSKLRATCSEREQDIQVGCNNWIDRLKLRTFSCRGGTEECNEKSHFMAQIEEKDSDPETLAQKRRVFSQLRAELCGEAQTPPTAKKGNNVKQLAKKWCASLPSTAAQTLHLSQLTTVPSLLNPAFAPMYSWWCTSTAAAEEAWEQGRGLCMLFETTEANRQKPSPANMMKETFVTGKVATVGDRKLHDTFKRMLLTYCRGGRIKEAARSNIPCPSAAEEMKMMLDGALGGKMADLIGR